MAPWLSGLARQSTFQSLDASGRFRPVVNAAPRSWSCSHAIGNSLWCEQVPEAVGGSSLEDVTRLPFEDNQYEGQQARPEVFLSSNGSEDHGVAANE